MGVMVERVARVIGCNNPEVCDYDKSDNPETCDLCLDRARAAIAAMREPTAAMVEAAYAEEDECGMFPTRISVWPTMIDAALSEGSET